MFTKMNLLRAFQRHLSWKSAPFVLKLLGDELRGDVYPMTGISKHVFTTSLERPSMTKALQHLFCLCLVFEEMTQQQQLWNLLPKIHTNALACQLHELSPVHYSQHCDVLSKEWSHLTVADMAAIVAAHVQACLLTDHVFRKALDTLLAHPNGNCGVDDMGIGAAIRLLYALSHWKL
ncbi:hypothetical protein RFI_37849, partial [Reticulomyxa filosa]